MYFQCGVSYLETTQNRISSVTLEALFYLRKYSIYTIWNSKPYIHMSIMVINYHGTYHIQVTP